MRNFVEENYLFQEDFQLNSRHQFEFDNDMLEWMTFNFDLKLKWNGMTRETYLERLTWQNFKWFQ
jgi:hypothetical protein